MRNDFDRLKSILLKDKMQLPSNTEHLMISDVIEAVEEYFEVNKDACMIEIKAIEQSGFDININIKANRLKIKKLSER